MDTFASTQFTELEHTRAQSTSISSIPPEVLLLIFSFIPIRYSGVNTPPSFADCLSVSQVCRRWRRLAYASPGLWTEIPQQKLSWTQLALELSKPLPISFHVFPLAFGSACSQSSAQLSLQNLARAENVILGIWPRYMPDGGARVPFRHTWLPQEDFYAPMLKSLIVAGVALNRDFSRGKSPVNLRRLVLVRSFVSFTMPIFKAPLTELALLDTRIQYQSSIEHPVIGILRMLPTLRHLVLDVLIISTRNQDVDENTPIYLPNLEYLRLMGGHQHVSSIISWLEVPLSTVLDIRTLNKTQSPHLQNATDPLISLKVHHFHRLPKTVSYTYARLSAFPLHAKSTPDTCFAFLLSDAIDTQALAPNFLYGVQRTPDWQERELFVDEAVSVLCSLPLTQNLQTLEVIHPSLGCLEDGGSTWLTIFSHWPTLERVLVRGASAASLAGLFAALGRARILPQLCSLEFECVDLKENGYARQLLAVVRRREPTLLVTVRNCDVPYNWLGEVGDMRSLFEWDGEICNTAVGIVVSEREEQWPDDELFSFPQGALD